MVRKFAPTIKSFLDGEFGDTLSIFLDNRKKQEEKNIKAGILNLQKQQFFPDYSDSQRDAAVESVRKSIRRLEDRKAYYIKRIRLLRDLDSSDFEKLLNKSSYFDGFDIDGSGYLNLYTKMLKDRAHEIGAFKISISPEQTGGLNFRAANMSYSCTHLDHWAINDNKCCLGEWQMDFESALFSGNIPDFFELFLHYITLSPEDHTYTTKKDWYETRVKRSKKDSEKLRGKSMKEIEEDNENEDVEEDEEEEDESLF